MDGPDIQIDLAFLSARGITQQGGERVSVVSDEKEDKRFCPEPLRQRAHEKSSKRQQTVGPILSTVRLFTSE